MQGTDDGHQVRDVMIFDYWHKYDAVQQEVQDWGTGVLTSVRFEFDCRQVRHWTWNSAGQLARATQLTQQI